LAILDSQLIGTLEKMRQVVARQFGRDPRSLGDYTVVKDTSEDHFYVQYSNPTTGEPTGCHDTDNMQSCSGTCPCE
jgi:hypothetical protein